ncbi:hypothetical protein ACIBL3_06935 [Kribbella sp. NPDC050124]|uniref:hypothetical protein n=1 Tax=Kribbella sp. NPDC050124 TaxID=3364114 RepID=UPI0037B826CA
MLGRFRIAARGAASTLVATGLVALCAVSATAQTVAVDDPIGDSAKNLNAQNSRSQDFLDIARVEISKDSDDFTMVMRLAVPVPTRPANPSGTDGELLWLFALNTQPGAIAGDPFPTGPGQARPFEYFCVLSWDGVSFKAFIIDRTAPGGEDPAIPFSFNAARTELTLVVDPALIGDPAAFEWTSLTAVRTAHVGSNGVRPSDFAGPASWPQ